MSLRIEAQAAAFDFVFFAPDLAASAGIAKAAIASAAQAKRMMRIGALRGFEPPLCAGATVARMNAAKSSGSSNRQHMQRVGPPPFPWRGRRDNATPSFSRTGCHMISQSPAISHPCAEFGSAMRPGNFRIPQR